MNQRIYKYFVKDYVHSRVADFEAYLNERLKKDHLEVVSITNSGCEHLCIVFRMMVDNCMG